MRVLRDLLGNLVRSGTLQQDRHGRVCYARREKKPSQQALTGIMRVSRRGIGVVHVEGSEEEIIIPPRFMGTALHGDRVAVVPFARRMTQRGDTDDRIEGEVIEVVERNCHTIVGTLERRGHFLVVTPDDSRIARDVYVTPERQGGAKPGDKVVVQLLPWEDQHLNPEGKVTEVLGRSGDARVEVMSVARTFGLPQRFPKEVEQEAHRLPEKITENIIAERIDLRRIPCITIDPEDAKDFDDAVSVETLPDGVLRLGVHIADVSHYVQPGSALDNEALKRGTSVYLVNEVIPMLPERLSNDLCSLKPQVDRLTYSVWMDVDGGGMVSDYRIARSVIHSARRFTYEEVQSIIERRRGKFSEVILPLHKLSQVLLQRRRKAGSIDFDTAEAKFEFDAHGFPSAIRKKVRLDAHRLIEECMLLANRTVAGHIGKARKEEDALRPFVYRVHDVPDPGKIEDLARFVKQFGYSLDPKSITPLSLQRLLDKVKGSEVENLINEVTLRAMAKAVYSENNIGHFGLGFKYYTHFTSPIRRYPDLVVHRLLTEYAGKISPKRLAALKKELPEICRISSERERVAMDAERQSVKVMQVEYMKRHLGDQFEGVIGGVTNFGIFVEINDLLVEGMIRLRDMADDYYLYDERHYALKGRSRGKVYRLGDKVRVRVVSIDPENREINFEIVR